MDVLESQVDTLYFSGDHLQLHGVVYTNYKVMKSPLRFSDRMIKLTKFQLLQCIVFKYLST